MPSLAASSRTSSITCSTTAGAGPSRGYPAQYTALVLDFFEHHLCAAAVQPVPARSLGRVPAAKVGLRSKPAAGQGRCERQPSAIAAVRQRGLRMASGREASRASHQNNVVLFR